MMGIEAGRNTAAKASKIQTFAGKYLVDKFTVCAVDQLL
jgi:hypothetical protein